MRRLALLVLLAGCASAPSVATRPATDASSTRGSLLIAGGGPLPSTVTGRFVELAGGPGRARIVLFPMASGDTTAGRSLAAEWRAKGVDARVVRITRAQATDSVARLLDSATGIWFGGGDQNRLTAAIGDTPVERAVHARYAAGAVVGGTSAGAAVMTGVMLTGDERRPGGDRPPRDSSAEAWMTVAADNVVTARGFDLLPGAVVDQHFLRRRRHNRLISLVLERPSLVGVGIDESTALEVQPGGAWRVVGSGQVLVYDARAARGTRTGGLGAAGVALHVLTSGSTFDPRRATATLP
ncbi:MAG: cyanophycinase [Gemmatirosa sp.]